MQGAGKVLQVPTLSRRMSLTFVEGNPDEEKAYKDNLKVNAKL